MRGPKRLAFLGSLIASATLFFLAAAPALASGPVLTISSIANSSAAPGSQFHYYVELRNLSPTDTTGETDMSATLPSGMTAVSADPAYGSLLGITCTAGDGSSPVAGASTVLCKRSSGLGTQRSDLFSGSEFNITVAVGPGVPDPSVLTASFQVSGSGFSTASTLDPTTIAAAAPAFGLDAFDGQVAANAAGDPYTQAAGTPYAASTELDFNLQSTSNPVTPDAQPIEPTKDVSVDLPPGFIGVPGTTPQCTASQLATGEGASCPATSQLGTSTLRLFSPNGQANAKGNADPAFGLANGAIPVFNMVQPPGVPARFGFVFSHVVVLLDAKLRSGGDYGLSVISTDANEALPLAGTSLTFWGVPADPSHDPERACPGHAPPWSDGITATDATRCLDHQGNTIPYVRPPLTSFLRNPTSCTGPLTTRVAIDSWFNPGATNADGSPNLADPNWKQASFVSHNPPGYPANPNDPSTPWGSPQGVTGCPQVPFNPSITIQPTSRAADSPTGLNVNLHMPQTQDPSQLAESDLKKAVVNLPSGMAVNPSAADGLGACTSAQITLHSNGPASCPDSAKVGTVSIDTPFFTDPLDGAIYLAKQQDNPNNNLLTIYIVASGHGVSIKLPGKIDADPNTGQLKATFDNQPQLPFSDLHLSFFSGDRASLTTPPTCGTKAAQASFGSWANPGLDVQRADSFAITSGPNGSPCPADAAHRPFAPTMSAGTVDPSAGKYSPFVLRLQRSPGEQELSSLQATLPRGVLGKLAGVSQCSDAALNSIPTALGTGAAEQANRSCPANSQVGYDQVGVGSGTPFYLTGRAYLAGPYKGAPLSLAVVTPALAGPFDLGNVVVRTALSVDPTTTQITATSDPLPTILDGIPLDLRDVRVNLDRPDFTLNPTSCDEMSVAGTATGTEGASANVSDRFQVGGCGRLGFKPRLKLSLDGGTKRAGHPALTSVLTYPKKGSYANIARAAVTLPNTMQLDQGHIRTICTRVQFAAGQCPARSVIGAATATSPLLDSPLAGPVYLRSSSHTLPDVVAALRGPASQPIEIDVVGRVDSIHKRLRTTFESVPDAPVSRFVLSLQGRRKGLLVNNTDLCRHDNRATVLLDGQNGKVANSTPKVNVLGCGGAQKRHRRRSG